MLSARPPTVFADGPTSSASPSPLDARRPRSTAFAVKTPGRHVLPSSHYTATGLKSALRKENAVGQGPRSTIARSKATVNLKEAIEPQRLFKDTDARKQPLGKGHGLHDVTNKTPAPSNHPLHQPFKTPLPATSLRSKLTSVAFVSAHSPSIDSPQQPAASPTAPLSRPLEPPPSALRPSSSRRSSRVIRSASKSFETPVSVPGSKKHWEVSEGDISVGALSETSIQEEVEEGLEDEDEIEYMAPTAYVEPYTPSFDMPDYKELCKDFMQVARMPGFGGPIQLYEEDFDMDPKYIERSIKDVPFISTKMLPEDDIFGPPLQISTAKINAAKLGNHVASRTAPTSASGGRVAHLKPQSGTITSTSSTARSTPLRSMIAASARSSATPRAGVARPGATRTPASKSAGGLVKSFPMKLAAAPAKPEPLMETLDVFLGEEFAPVDGEFMFDL